VAVTGKSVREALLREMTTITATKQHGIDDWPVE
jgi:hypothetical protein